MEQDLEDEYPPEVADFRRDACLKKMLGVPLTPEEQAVVEEVAKMEIRP